VFTALLCYAKITPAALQRGDFAERCREDAGWKRKFELSDSPRVIAGSAATFVQAPDWQEVKQRVPDA
jgi:hypothetical protein